MPPSCGTDVFNGVPATATLMVYKSAKEAYANADQWKDFIITTMPDADAIESIATDAPTTCKDGKFLKNGRLIIRKAGKTYNASGVEM